MSLPEGIDLPPQPQGVWDTSQAELALLRAEAQIELLVELFEVGNGEDDVIPLPPGWWRDAACQTRPKTLFYPEKGADTAKARAVGARCRVSLECLRYAIQHSEQGIWGGLTEEERRQLYEPIRSNEAGRLAKGALLEATGV